MKTIKFLSLLIILSIFIGCDRDTDDSPAEPVNIDLKAESITFSVVPTSQFAGNATITGTIKNIGDNFSSGVNQQGILLYERPLGAPAPGNLVGQMDFTTLAAGQTLQVSFTRPWNASSPAEGEFPPEYILRISYDPDLYIDDNIHNDDSNSANNSITVSGGAINTMF